MGRLIATRRSRVTSASASAVVVVVALAVTLLGSGSLAGLRLSVNGKSFQSSQMKLSSYYAPTSSEGRLENIQADLAGDLNQLTWSPQTTPSGTPNLTAVAPSGGANNAVWAVGANCTLLYDQSNQPWQKVSVAGCTSNLTGVFIFDNGHGWATGSGGVILVCTNNCQAANATWAQLTSSPVPSTTTLSSVWAFDPNHVYAVGTTSAGAGVIWACSNGCNNTTSPQAQWALVTPGSANLSSTSLLSVSGIANTPPPPGGTPPPPGGAVFVTGSNGTILACSGNNCANAGANANWATVQIQAELASGTVLDGVFAADANDAYAVGSTPAGGVIWGCSANCTATAVGSGTGQADWTNVTPLGGLASTLLSVSGSGSNVAWAVGQSGTVELCLSSCAANSAAWVPQELGVTTATLAGTASTTNGEYAWVVGAQGTVLFDDLYPPPPSSPQPQQTCNGKTQAANPTGHLESLIANPSPAAGSQVNPGATFYALYTDDQPMATTQGSTASPQVVLDGSTTLTPTVTATESQTPTYVDQNGGSAATTCQDSVAFSLPSTLSTGAHSVVVTTYDSDNDHDVYTWNFSVVASPTEPGGTPIPIVSPPPPPPPVCGGNAQAANATGHLESLIANPSPAPGASVNPGATFYSLYTDDQPMATTSGSTASPHVVLDGTTTLTPTVAATSSQTPSYVDSNGGSTSINCQDSVAFTLPSAVTTGAHSVVVTTYDSDNDHDTFTWNFTVVSSPTEPGGTPIPTTPAVSLLTTVTSMATALADVSAALAPNYWPGCDVDHVDGKTGAKVFADLQAAVAALVVIENVVFTPPFATSIPTEIANLDTAARQIASTSVTDAQTSPQGPNAAAEIAQAQADLTAGDSLASGGHPDTAVADYQQAWALALEAEGQSGIVMELLGSGNNVLQDSGQSTINANGWIDVNSSTNGSVNLSGQATINAGILVSPATTPVNSSGQATFNVGATLQGGPLADPDAGLAAPSTTGLTTYTTNNSLPGPGIYTQSVNLAGNTAYTMASGTYIFDNGFQVSGQATLTSATGGVLVYMAGGALQTTGQAGVTLSPLTTGPYSGIVYFQSRTDNQQVNLSGQSQASAFNGTLYAPDAPLQASGQSGLVINVLIASTANFSGQSVVDIGNSLGLPTGPQSCGLSDSDAGQAILSGLVVPGGSITKTVAITTTGSDENVVTLSESNITHSTSACPAGVPCPPGFSTANLAHALQLTIVDTSNSNKLIYQGALDSMPTITVCGAPSGSGCPTWGNNESHTFTFTVALANQACVSPPVTLTLANCPDNVYQGTSASVQFTWQRSS